MWNSFLTVFPGPLLCAQYGPSISSSYLCVLQLMSWLPSAPQCCASWVISLVSPHSSYSSPAVGFCPPWSSEVFVHLSLVLCHCWFLCKPCLSWPYCPLHKGEPFAFLLSYGRNKTSVLSRGAWNMATLSSEFWLVCVLLDSAQLFPDNHVWSMPLPFVFMGFPCSVLLPWD